MLTNNDIATAIYKELAEDATLTGQAAVYKGERRPAGFANPSVTVVVRKLEPDAGYGMWSCDIEVTAYADVLDNDMPDISTLDTLTDRIVWILDDAEIDIDDARTMPVMLDSIEDPRWHDDHYHEYTMTSRFDLMFLYFGEE